MTSSTSSSSGPLERAPGSHRTLASLALAVLMPILVVAAWAWAFTPEEEVFLPSKAALALEEELAADPPDVVLLGNSTLNHGVDEARLAEAIGLKVAKLRVPASYSASWYAVLKNRVYANGYTPKLVLVVAPLDHAAAVSWDSDPTRPERLRDQMGPDEPLIEERVFGNASTWPPLDASRDFADQIVDAVKYGTVGLFFRDSDEQGLVARGRATADPALERVFDIESGTDLGLFANALPVARFDDTRTSGEGGDYDFKRGFMGEIMDLAQEHGSRMIFVRLPAPESYDGARHDPALLAELEALLDEKGGALIDLSDMPLPPLVFVDHVHMNATGRELFTDALARALEERGALGDGPLLPPVEPLAVDEVATEEGLSKVEIQEIIGGRRPCVSLVKLDPSWLRLVSERLTKQRYGVDAPSPVKAWLDGEPLPAVPAPSLSCETPGVYHDANGLLVAAPDERSLEGRLKLDVETPAPRGGERGPWWVMPKGKVTLSFDGGWEGARAEDVDVVVQALITGDSRATVTADGRSDRFREDGSRHVAKIPRMKNPTGPWTITVEAGGDPVLIQRVMLRSGGASLTVLGPSGAGGAHKIISKHSPAPTVTGPAPIALEEINAPKRTGDEPPHTAFMFAPGLEAVGAFYVMKETALPRCSPVRILEDGKPLAGPNALAEDTRVTGMGAYSHTKQAFYISSSDNSDPTQNGRSYTAALDPGRVCKGGIWVYPGDKISVAVPIDGGLPVDGRVLSLAVTRFGAEKANPQVTLRLRQGEALLLETETRVNQLVGAWQGPLSAVVPRGTEAVTLEVELQEAGVYLLVTGAALLEEAW
ncbi:MAG: hypothetical protein H6740_08375 [Alphaproteobacteria bacterium]|nr:hypothetical protein [Alphaproteobacteria bacterium]